jgi:hypothetical protein
MTGGNRALEAWACMVVMVLGPGASMCWLGELPVSHWQSAFIRLLGSKGVSGLRLGLGADGGLGGRSGRPLEVSFGGKVNTTREAKGCLHALETEGAIKCRAEE